MSKKRRLQEILTSSLRPRSSSKETGTSMSGSAKVA